MKKIIKEKGITLIALIVTIIILLILAGITISQLSNSGLFDKSKIAKEKSENAQLDENDKIGQYENEIDAYANPFIGGISRFDTDFTIDTLTASNFPFTVPENGFLQIYAVGYNAYVYVDGASSGKICTIPYGGAEQTAMGFVKKGDTLTIVAGGNYTIKYIH